MPSILPLVKYINFGVFLLAAALIVYLIRKGTIPEKSFLIFIGLSIEIAAALDTKVSSKLLYLPSIGVAIIFGSLLVRLGRNLVGVKRALLIILLIIYLVGHAIAINLTIISYRKTQVETEYLLDKLEQLDIDWFKYDYMLFDNIPGRVKIGFALRYRFGFAKKLIDVTGDNESGPDLQAAKARLKTDNISYISIDFSTGEPIVKERFTGNNKNPKTN